MKSSLIILFYLFLFTAYSQNVLVQTTGTAFTTYGKYLTNSAGMSLYIDGADFGKSTPQCTSSCLTSWPPATVTASPATGDSNVQSSMLSTVTRTDDNSAIQITYNSWPLYTYTGDSSAGQTTGQGIGNKFFLISPTGNPIFTTSTNTALDTSVADTAINSATYDSVDYLVDYQGHTLYTFAADSFLTATCYTTCATAWPPFTVASGDFPSAGTGVSDSLIYTITRTDNTIQVTYNGWPLYYFAGEPANDITCQDVDLNGGYWYVIQPDGAIYKQAISSAADSSTSTGTTTGTGTTYAMKKEFGIIAILMLLCFAFMI